jgi:glutamate formiminotransferase/formiminotetrahydrofolate cyclodeaminase
MAISDFADELASESAAPGGGSVAALCGSLSAALSAMVANLTHDKKGFESARTVMDDIASRGQALKKGFLSLVDEDTQAFNRIIEARRMPKATDEEKHAREAAILEANKQATLVPLWVLKSTLTAVELAELVIEKGNPNSLSDGGVAASAARAAAEGAYYNVLINLSGIEDKQFSDSTREEANKFLFEVRRRCESLHETMLSKLNSGG